MKNAGVDRGSVELVPTESSGSSSEDNLISKLRKREIRSNEAFFKKLKNNPSARSSLASIHSARSYKYGHVHFGPKSWYKESSNVSEKLTSQEDRRKFRQGLKCDIDFLNQLNMHDIMKTLLEGERDLNSLPKKVKTKLGDMLECLKEVPVLDILKFIDSERAHKILSSLDKIVSLAHVSQSMGNYFARDDSLDPALSIVCEGLRGDTDFEYILRSRGGTFQSLASAYNHLKSAAYHDATGRTDPSRSGEDRAANMSKTRRRTSSRRGICWFFQKQRGCAKRVCNFDHRCRRCDKKDHGEYECRSFWGRG